MEVQAQEFLRQKNWMQAIDLFNRLLTNKNSSVEQVVSYLTDRAECYLELNNHQAVITDSKHIIKLSPDINNYNVCLARKRLIHSLYMLKRYTGKVYSSFCHFKMKCHISYGGEIAVLMLIL